MRPSRMFGTDLSHPPVPTRGVLLSVLAHALFLLATLIVPWDYWLPPTPRLITQAEQLRQEPLTLPRLLPKGGGRPSASAPGGGMGQPKRKPQPAPSNQAEATRGVVYKGRQLVVSNPPRPDNFKQTIRQPSMRKAPRIPAPLPVPAMVSVAPAMPAVKLPEPQAPQKRPVAVLPRSVARKLAQVKAPELALPAAPKQLPQNRPADPVRALPLSVSNQLAKVEAPKLSLPAAPQELPQTAQPLAPVRELPRSVSRKAAKVAAPGLPAPVGATSEQSPLQAVAGGGPAAEMPKFAPGQVALDAPANSTRNILVLNAVSNPDAKPAEIPPGELHGSFTVSTIGSSVTGLAGGGSVGTGSPGDASGTKSGPYAGVGGPVKGGSSAGAGVGNGISTGVSTGVGSGNEIGGGNGGSSSGAGSGTASGKLAGTGTGRGKGSGGGQGGGTGRGSSPFPEVMIQGGSQVGSGRGGGRTTVGVSFGPQVRPSYGITVVANGASGGGFPDYGIFRNSTSYTVYLDMSDEGLRGKSWPLQYALQRRSADSGEAKRQSLLVSPYPVSKQLPKFTPEEAERNHGRRVVVLGVIREGGGWQTLRVMQSPDPELNPVVLDALRLWVFKPAEMNGTPVAVKCLLGVMIEVPQR